MLKLVSSHFQMLLAQNDYDSYLNVAVSNSAL